MLEIDSQIRHENVICHRHMNQSKTSSLSKPKNTEAPSRSKKRDKLDLIVKLLSLLSEEEFTGWVKINFSQGTIGRVEKFEEVLKGK